MNMNVCSLFCLIRTLSKLQIIFKNPVTKEVFIFRHVLVVKSSLKANPFLIQLLAKLVICQTLLLFKRFSSKYHLIHEIF